MVDKQRKKLKNDEWRANNPEKYRENLRRWAHKHRALPKTEEEIHKNRIWSKLTYYRKMKTSDPDKYYFKLSRMESEKPQLFSLLNEKLEGGNLGEGEVLTEGGNLGEGEDI